MSAEVLSVCCEALHMAIDAGALISFDPNLRPELLPPEEARQSFAEFMKFAAILLPTSAELLSLTAADSVDQAVATLLAERPERIIVVTRGAAGCTVFNAAGAVDVPGYAVDEVDPTGAGDCFDAAFISALLAGKSTVEAAQLANACGALAVTAKGPMAGAKSLAEVEQFMQIASTNSL